MNMPPLSDALVEQVKREIDNADKIAIVSHMNADGDAVGSVLGLCHILKALGKANIVPILPNGVPETFAYLPGSEMVMNGDTDLEGCKLALRQCDLVVCVDFNTAPRIDKLATALVESKARKLMIDHHHSPDNELIDTMVSVPELSSACELVVWTLTACYGKGCINQQAAKCLYNGICTDTGSFAFSNEDPSVYEAAALLVGHDIGAANIHNQIDCTFTVERMRFWGFAISQRLHIFEEQRFAYFSISLDDMKEGHVTGADLEGLVNYTLKMKCIEVGALVREEPGRVKVSLRSKYDVDVNQIAREHLGGGGHTKAAGATCTGWTLEQTCQKLEEIFLK